jgi:hypothetical protein
VQQSTQPPQDSIQTNVVTGPSRMTDVTWSMQWAVTTLSSELLQAQLGSSHLSSNLGLPA